MLLFEEEIDAVYLSLNNLECLQPCLELRILVDKRKRKQTSPVDWMLRRKPFWVPKPSVKWDIEWDREDDYSGVLKDHFNTFRNLGRQAVERIPDKALQRAGQVLFGKGRTKLASGSVGMDLGPV